MKKIVIAFIEYSVPGSVVKFAVELAAAHKASLYALFLNSERNLKQDGSFASDSNETSFSHTAERLEKDVNAEENAIGVFSDACREANISFHVQIHRIDHLDVLLDNSEFADLLLADARSQPLQFSLKALLSNINCPALLVPFAYQKTEHIIFTYDDISPGLFATKAFTYLFGNYNHLPASFISAVMPNILGIQYHAYIQDWLNLHYPGTEIEILKGEAKDILPEYINNKKNALVIMGAYGRSRLSNLFKESLGSHILHHTGASLFIAHK